MNTDKDPKTKDAYATVKATGGKCSFDLEIFVTRSCKESTFLNNGTKDYLNK
jgi:hypothetical protein